MTSHQMHRGLPALPPQGAQPTGARHPGQLAPVTRVPVTRVPVNRAVQAPAYPTRPGYPTQAASAVYSGMSREQGAPTYDSGVAVAPSIAPAGAPAFTAMIVDDHPLIRESMSVRLRAMGATEVLEAASAAEARARARTGPRDLAVIDIGLPDGSGIELVGYLRSEGWGRVVILSAADDPYSVRAAFVAGAQGYLLKSATTAIVTDGVRQVLGGGVYADPSVASLLAAGLRTGGTAENGLSELSGREIEVLRLVADGKSNKEIGDALGLSALTVKSHLARIARKLGTGDRAEMVALAMRAGVIR